MIRRVIHIDEDKCTGCGLCVSACHEGAIGLVGGKARLMRDDYCDGLGDCLPSCPTGAITFVEREAAAYDEEAVRANMAAKEARMAALRSTPPAPRGCPGAAPQAIKPQGGCPGSAPQAVRPVGMPPAIGKPKAAPAGGCPGSLSQFFAKEAAAPASPAAKAPAAHASGPAAPAAGEGAQPASLDEAIARIEQAAADAIAALKAAAAGAGAPDRQQADERPSELASWPAEIKLVPVQAPYFAGAHLLVAADCTAFAYGDFHRAFMRGRTTVIGCPKLDGVDYTEKLAAIIAGNDIASVTVARMEVPCCGGLENAARRAVEASGKDIPFDVVTIGVRGNLL